MNGASIFFFIVGTCVLAVGYYMFSGHEIGILKGRPAFKELVTEQWKNIGKWTMIASSAFYIIGLLIWFFDVD